MYIGELNGWFAILFDNGNGKVFLSDNPSERRTAKFVYECFQKEFVKGVRAQFGKDKGEIKYIAKRKTYRWTLEDPEAILELLQTLVPYLRNRKQEVEGYILSLEKSLGKSQTLAKEENPIQKIF